MYVTIYDYCCMLCIGFQRNVNQNTLDYILDIANDRGKMSFTGYGKRNATLSPEDLADINRSLSHIKAGGNVGNGIGGSSLAEVEEEAKAVISHEDRVSSASSMMYRITSTSTNRN